MACPFFLPDSRPAPLSDLHGGECAAEPGVSVSAGLLTVCNYGYARATCRRAAQSDADAFRLLVRADNGSLVEVAWSSERNHHPVAVGTLSLKASGSAAEPHPLERQARVCVDAYFRQTGN